MALKLRKRGDYWHIKGTVRVGKETEKMAETTGCKIKEDAEAYRAKREVELRAFLLDGSKVTHRQFIFADAAEEYLNRPDVHRNDEWRILELCKHMEGYSVFESPAAWQVFKTMRCAHLKPSSTTRFRKVAQAALNLLGDKHNFEAPKLEKPKRGKGGEKEELRVRFLEYDEQESLLSAYTKHVQPIVLFLCFEGARTQECLQLKWRRVNFAKNTVYFDKTKNRESRTVPLHSRVRAALEKLAAERNPESDDHVFLNRFGRPYADTRDYALPGGNPIAKAHKTACKRAKIKDFRVHDWRHHWASHHMMNGTDPETLRKMGGWSSFEMLQRYAGVSDRHMQEVIENVA